MPRPRTVLVTAASSGIGRALAIELAARGAEVALAARRKDELDLVARTVAERGGTARVFPLDVADAGAVHDVVRRAEVAMGSLDMVVANAGVGSYGQAATTSWDEIERVFAVNTR